MTAAAVYTRISQDDGSALGVARQQADCLLEANRRGWPVAEVFTDNDVSATNSKVRPAYRRMLDAIEARRIDAVIVWDVDRLTRTPSELEGFISLADRRALALASVGGEIDLATPQGRLTARIKGDVARHEVEQLSRRLKRKYEEVRAEGKRHGGPVPFGYRRLEEIQDGKRARFDVVDEVEAEALRECYRRVLAGDSLRSVAKFMDSIGPTPRGNAWDGATIGRMLQKPGYAGLITYQGEIMGPGQWTPIVDRETFDAVGSILRDPKRAPSRGRELVYLGAGIYRCGKCGGVMRPVASTRREPAYACTQCMKLTRKASAVDEVVEAVVVARLQRPDLLPLLNGDDAAMQDGLKARDVLLARMDHIADQFAAGEVTARQLARINERLRADLDRAEAIVSAARGTSVLGAMAGSEAAKAWAEASLERRRAVIRELVQVTILPTGPGIRFEPDQVRFDWRSS